MHINNLSGKRILMLGYGKEGQAMTQALKKHVDDCALTIAEKYPDLEVMGMDIFGIYAGQRRYLDPLSSFDVIIKSPGIPPNAELQELGTKLTSSTQIFLDTIKDSGAMVIGVTGSKGKSTTASLIYAILKAAEKDVHLIGNIGEPAISHIDEAKPGTIFVLEMSSYQLMDLSTSPHIAVVTSFFPEHLDYHGSLEAYREAKAHIARFQKKDNAIFFNTLFEDAKWIANESTGKKIAFSAADAPVQIEETKLIGQHNLSNIAAAFLVCSQLGIDRHICIKAITSFEGLPHRLQNLGVHGGITWIDDAISTTPESTIAALDALGDNVLTIILGGQDRGNGFMDLGQRIAQSSIKTVIVFPGSGPRIRKAIQEASAQVEFVEVTSMEEAVLHALNQTKNEKPKTNNLPIVLLSTASPSYGMFKNFEEKGEQFRACIEQ